MQEAVVDDNGALQCPSDSNTGDIGDLGHLATYNWKM